VAMVIMMFVVSIMNTVKVGGGMSSHCGRFP
jgi:hypothetical protein